MTAHDPELGRPASGILGWLGFGGRQAAAPGGAPREARPAGERRGSLQQRQLEEIGAFLTLHKLEVDADMLAIAWRYLTGSDSQVVRAIDRRLQLSEPVTAEWLAEELGPQQSGDDAALLAQLMERLENSIDEFGRTSRDAQTATREYNSAL
ncbi:MAG TPA: hypothetical protein VFV30_08380, partial [Novosphingobium sp.]|nr:hypothetical protein [Novosphingobium sp.]